MREVGVLPDEEGEYVGGRRRREMRVALLEAALACGHETDLSSSRFFILDRRRSPVSEDELQALLRLTIGGSHPTSAQRPSASDASSREPAGRRPVRGALNGCTPIAAGRGLVSTGRDPGCRGLGGRGQRATGARRVRAAVGGGPRLARPGSDGPLLLAAILWLAPLLDGLYPGPDQHVFPQLVFLLKPEPLEATRYLIAAVAPVVLAGVVLAVSSRRQARRSLDGRAVIAVQLVAIGLLTWSVTQQIHVPPLTRPDYFDPLLLSIPNVVAGILIGAALTAVSQLAPRVPGGRRWAIGAGLRGSAWIALGVALAVTVIWLLPALVTDATVAQAGGRRPDTPRRKPRTTSPSPTDGRLWSTTSRSTSTCCRSRSSLC